MKLARDEGARFLVLMALMLRLVLALVWSSRLSKPRHMVGCGDEQNLLIVLTELLSVSSILMMNVLVFGRLHSSSWSDFSVSDL